MRASLAVDVSGSVRGFPKAGIEAWIGRCVSVIERAGAAPFRVRSVSIAFVDDETMRELNRRFRKRNRTTDVLTFEGGDDGAATGFLGEIVISRDRAKCQAREERHSLATEVRYLLLHGLLHACGFDHETDQGQMDALEVRVRTKLGLL